MFVLYRRLLHKWIMQLQISDLSVIINRAGSAFVQDQGWFLFGGYKNELLKAQKLSTPGNNPINVFCRIK